MKIDIVIPTYKPGKDFPVLLQRLEEQELPPGRILVINTEKAFWDPSWEETCRILEVHHISKEEFDHGGTRRMAADLCDGDILVFMTQDAMPADRRLLRCLTEALCKEAGAGAAYARQLPRKDAGPIERSTRAFNYPAVSHVYYEKDVAEHGIKTFYCSNVCAAYSREAYQAAGGFLPRTIFGEDMMLAEKLIRNGYGIVYAADAVVIHSHDYSCREQFRRNFDIGVSHAEHPEVYASVPSEGEGIRMVRMTAARLLGSGHFYLLPYLVVQSGCKYAGYRLGKMYRKIPRALVRRLSFNPGYFA